MGLVEWYNHLMVDLRDPRVDSWLGMYSIWPTIIICSAYVYFVKVLGPRYFFFLRHCQVEMFALITTSEYGGSQKLPPKSSAAFSTTLRLFLIYPWTLDLGC